MPERGAATVEMALFSIFLVLLVMGIADLGRAIHTAIAVDDVVQEGVVYASFTEGASVSDVQARASTAASSPAISAGSITVTCTTIERDGVDSSRVTVAASSHVDLVTPFVSDLLGGSLTLQRSATAERYYADCPT